MCVLYPNGPLILAEWTRISSPALHERLSLHNKFYSYYQCFFFYYYYYSTHFTHIFKSILPEQYFTHSFKEKLKVTSIFTDNYIILILPLLYWWTTIIEFWTSPPEFNMIYYWFGCMSGQSNNIKLIATVSAIDSTASNVLEVEMVW